MAVQHLRGDVPLGATRNASSFCGEGTKSLVLAYAKITDCRLPISPNQHIFELNVPVDNAMVVEVGQPLARPGEHGYDEHVFVH